MVHLTKRGGLGAFAAVVAVTLAGCGLQNQTQTQSQTDTGPTAAAAPVAPGTVPEMPASLAALRVSDLAERVGVEPVSDAGAPAAVRAWFDQRRRRWEPVHHGDPLPLAVTGYDASGKVLVAFRLGLHKVIMSRVDVDGNRLLEHVIGPPSSAIELCRIVVPPDKGATICTSDGLTRAPHGG